MGACAFWKSLIFGIASCTSLASRGDGIIAGFSSICYGHWPGTNLSPSVIALNPAWGNALDRALSIQFGFNHSQTAMRPEQPSSYEALTISPFDLRGSLFGVATVSDKVSLGLGIYSPLRMEGQWANDWMGRYVVRQFSFQPWVAQPTFGYKLSDRLSAALAPILAFGNMTYNRAVNLQNQSAADGSMMLSASGFGYGGKAGVFADFDRIGVGFSATLPLTTTMTGDAQFEVPAALNDSFPSTTFSVPIHSAPSLGLQVCFETDEASLFSAGIDYSLSRSDDSSRIDFASNTSFLPDEFLYLNRKPELAIWAGVCAVSLTPKWQANLGAFYSTGTAVTGHLTPLYPDAGKAGLVVGVTRPIVGGFALCISVNYMEAATISGTSEPHGFDATYKSRTWGLQLGITWK